MKGVFVWQVHPGQEQEFIKRWKFKSRLFQQCPGAQGTKLHRGEGGRFMAYASWRSKQDRDVANARLREEHPEAFGDYSTDRVSDVLFVGFFNDPGLVVSPTGIAVGPDMTPCSSFPL
jgi:heme-degrading monooxygenase HmoA